MQVATTPQKLSKSDALNIAIKKGGFLGKLIVKQEIKYTVKPISIFRTKKSNINKPKESKINILCDCTTGVAALADSLPNFEVKEVEDKSIKDKLINDDELLKRSKKLAFKLIHKHNVGHPYLESWEIKEIYRPFWVAIYGKFEQGNKIRYLPIQADGHNIQRTF
jgi:hypothetical protein